MVCLTKGEGFGRPLLEFSLVKKPILTTGWSGHVDFLDKEFVTLLGGQLTNVHPSAANQFLLKDSQWFSPDQGQIGYYLKDMFENYKKYTEGAKRQAYRNKQKFSWESMKDDLNYYFKEYIPEFPKEVELVIPKLSKINLPSLKKIES